MNLQETIRKVLKETTSLPLIIKRRLKLSEEEIIDIVRGEVMTAYRTDDISPKKAASIGCRNAAFEIISKMDLPIDDDDEDGYHKLEIEVSNFLKGRYLEQMTNFLEGFLDSSGDELGYRYTFWKHADRYGGNGFSESYETWNKLLRAYSSWFPDLDWAEVKSKLDRMVNGHPLLIKNPADRNNRMGYYFSVIKRKLK
jgi:hypothetical protein